jgi:hypothetical protein
VSELICGDIVAVLTVTPRERVVSGPGATAGGQGSAHGPMEGLMSGSSNFNLQQIRPSTLNEPQHLQLVCCICVEAYLTCSCEKLETNVKISWLDILPPNLNHSIKYK